MLCANYYSIECQDRARLRSQQQLEKVVQPLNVDDTLSINTKVQLAYQFETDLQIYPCSIQLAMLHCALVQSNAGPSLSLSQIIRIQFAFDFFDKRNITTCVGILYIPKKAKT